MQDDVYQLFTRIKATNHYDLDSSWRSWNLVAHGAEGVCRLVRYNELVTEDEYSVTAWEVPQVDGSEVPLGVSDSPPSVMSTNYTDKDQPSNYFNHLQVNENDTLSNLVNKPVLMDIALESNSTMSYYREGVVTVDVGDILLGAVILVKPTGRGVGTASIRYRMLVAGLLRPLVSGAWVFKINWSQKFSRIPIANGEHLHYSIDVSFLGVYGQRILRVLG